MFIYRIYNHANYKGGEKKMILSILNYFEDTKQAINDIKNIIIFFYDSVDMMFDLIPSPFNVILKLALIVILAIIIIRIVRG